MDLVLNESVSEKSLFVFYHDFLHQNIQVSYKKIATLQFSGKSDDLANIFESIENVQRIHVILQKTDFVICLRQCGPTTGPQAGPD